MSYAPPPGYGEQPPYGMPPGYPPYGGYAPAPADPSAELASVQAENAALKSENAALKAEIAELRVKFNADAASHGEELEKLNEKLQRYKDVTKKLEFAVPIFPLRLFTSWLNISNGQLR